MTTSSQTTPFPDSYWVMPGKLLAGEYPTSRFFEEETRRRMMALLNCGISVFIDLTKINEREPYLSVLQVEAGAYGIPVQYFKHPIEDFSTPTVEEMKAILDQIDYAHTEGKAVYVHCWGGIGRTGTVVGCYLVRQGLSGSQALGRITELRSSIPGGWMRSPESDQQAAFVMNWQDDNPAARLV
jgi:protein-tyrosine phosphatase